MITIPKPGKNLSCPSSYRTITLLPVLGKLYEKILADRIETCLNQYIPSYQFGFRKETSTLVPLSILVSNIQNFRLQKFHSAAIFLDINKAFDSVWHEGLLYKLHSLNCPDYLLTVIRDFLNNRQISVKVNNEVSKNFSLEKGLPQGSPLSPILFNILCHDIYNHTYIDKNTFDIHAYILQFADDTTLVAHGRTRAECQQRLTILTNKTLEWFYRWRLEPNEGKSQFICFYDRQPPHNIQIGQHTVEPQSECRYLGLQLDKNLNLKSHLKLVKQKTLNRSKHLRKLTYRQQGISRKQATLLYKVLCRPLIDYGAILFSTCTPNVYKILETTETTSLRIITRIRHPRNILWNPSNQLLYNITNCEQITTRQHRLNTTFTHKPHNMHLINKFTIPLPNPPLLRTPRHTLTNIFAQLSLQPPP